MKIFLKSFYKNDFNFLYPYFCLLLWSNVSSLFLQNKVKNNKTTSSLLRFALIQVTLKYLNSDPN